MSTYRPRSKVGPSNHMILLLMDRFSSVKIGLIVRIKSVLILYWPPDNGWSGGLASGLAPTGSIFSLIGTFGYRHDSPASYCSFIRLGTKPSIQGLPYQRDNLSVEGHYFHYKIAFVSNSVISGNSEWWYSQKKQWLNVYWLKDKRQENGKNLQFSVTCNFWLANIWQHVPL